MSVKTEGTSIEMCQLRSTLKSDLCGVSCAERCENLQPVSRTLKALWQVQTSAAAQCEEKKKKQQPQRPDPRIITAAAPDESILDELMAGMRDSSNSKLVS